MGPSKASFWYLLIGLVVGFLLGSCMADGLLSVANKAVTALAIIFLALFGRKMDAFEHLRNLTFWEAIRQHGRLQFIMIRYLILRGGILTTIILLPLLKTFYTWTQSEGWFALIAAIVLMTVIYLGNEEWKNCEREYETRLLRHAAEDHREASSLMN
ncbi:MAG TPA: hypothetical protein VL126_12755 [Bacteroidota bacterium]|nr:hypothetical protein [Bacteroidota bacterium]